jgi:hypothetical protein
MKEFLELFFEVKKVIYNQATIEKELYIAEKLLEYGKNWATKKKLLNW